jgi:hypothetical protein
MPKTFSPNDKKFEELVLYIASESEEDETFSATKLNKLLFFADFYSYASQGEPVTGHRYQKLPNGPAPIAFLPVIQRMEEEGACSWEERPYFNHTQKRLVAQRNPDLTQFSKEQLKLVDHLIERFWNVSAREVSEASHELPSWSAFGMQEEIPYETIFVLPPRALSKGELERAAELEDP